MIWIIWRPGADGEVDVLRKTRVRGSTPIAGQLIKCNGEVWAVKNVLLNIDVEEDADVEMFILVEEWSEDPKIEKNKTERIWS